LKVELHGLQLFGYHGVGDDERRQGQIFLYDVELEVGNRGASDRVEDAVDYRDVAALVRDVASERFDLLEALATTLADRVLAAFRVEHVTVRVRKPEVRPAGIDLDFAAVTVERP
jgi:dihydroneopterin aldolase